MVIKKHIMISQAVIRVSIYLIEHFITLLDSTYLKFWSSQTKLSHSKNFSLKEIIGYRSPEVNGFLISYQIKNVKKDSISYYIICTNLNFILIWGRKLDKKENLTSAIRFYILVHKTYLKWVLISLKGRSK